MTINRRLFIGTLVVVAAGSSLLSSLAAPVESAVIPKTSLLAVRDLLLPAVWLTADEYGSDYESDIMVDFKSDALIVRAYRFSTKQEFGFALLRTSIDSGSYKAEFRLTLDRLFKMLSQAYSNEG